MMQTVAILEGIGIGVAFSVVLFALGISFADTWKELKERRKKANDSKRSD